MIQFYEDHRGKRQRRDEERRVKFYFQVKRQLGFPGGLVVKNLPANTGDSSLTGRWVIEDPAVMYVRECFAYILL